MISTDCCCISSLRVGIHDRSYAITDDHDLRVAVERLDALAHRFLSQDPPAALLQEWIHNEAMFNLELFKALPLVHVTSAAASRDANFTSADRNPR